jgi:hypothetical protein
MLAAAAAVDLLEIQLPTLAGLVEEETERAGTVLRILHLLRVVMDWVVAVVVGMDKEHWWDETVEAAV